jgi:hypothetical protein
MKRTLVIVVRGACFTLGVEAAMIALHAHFGRKAIGGLNPNVLSPEVGQLPQRRLQQMLGCLQS